MYFSSLLAYLLSLLPGECAFTIAMTVYRWKQEIRGITHLHMMYPEESIIPLKTFHPSHVPGIAAPSRPSFLFLQYSGVMGSHPWSKTFHLYDLEELELEP
ncbi:MAG: hypothetical protein HXS42_15770 [Theionarchaea archaeon]|nr:hypothetical protein [Theionarchaea archaeon]